MKKRFAWILALVLVLALALTGCGASSSGMYVSQSAKGATADYAVTEPAAMEEAYWDSNAATAYNSSTAYGGVAGADVVRRSAKLIYTANMDMATLEFDQAVADIDDLVAKLGGYCQQRSIHQGGRGYRYADFTVRVPAEQFDAFCNQVGQLCHVTYASSGAEEISDSYYDTESRLNTAKAKLERLQSLLEQAEDMEDIITIENAISDVEWQIDNLSGTLRNYDSLVDYATVYVSLSEVYKLSNDVEAPLTFGQRLANSFTNGLRSVAYALEDFAMWLAYSWVWLVVIAAVVVVIVRVIKKKGFHFPKFKGRKGKKNKAEDDTNDTPQE